MFDTKLLTKNGSMARRLIDFSKIKKIIVPDSLKELAKTDLINPKDYSRFSLNQDELNAAQFAVDWKYRGIVLSHDDSVMTLALSLALVNKKLPLLILTGSDEQKEKWRTLASSLADQDIFETKSTHAKNVSKPSIWIENFNVPLTYVEKINPQFVIVDNLTEKQYFNNDSISHIIDSIMSVVECFMVFQNINYVFNKNTNNVEAFFFSVKNFNCTLKDSMLNSFWNELNFNALLSPKNYEKRINVREYLKEKQYYNIHMNDFLRCFSVSTHLLKVSKTRISHIIDNTYSKRSIFFQKYDDKKQDLENKTKLTIEEIIDSNLNGKPISISSLFSLSWCNAKLDIVKGFLNEFSVMDDKTLIIAEDPQWMRSIGLNLKLNCGNLNNLSNLISGYLHPNPKWKKYYQGSSEPLKINTLALNLYEINEDILEQTKNIIILEYPLEKVDFDSLVELCELYNINLFCITLANTWEEYLTKQLNI